MDVTSASQVLWNKGERILQGNRLGSTDKKHIDALAFYINLRGDEEHIADMGCGFGEVSKILCRKRNGNQAMYWLVNNNKFQMEKCLEWDGPCAYIERDMIDTGISDDKMDLVMFNWSLCHVNPVLALREAWRITRHGGRLFVYDYARMMGDNKLTSKLLNARFLHDSEFRFICMNEIMWMEIETIYPGGDDTIFRQAIGDPALCDKILLNLKPVIWKAVK